MGTPFGATIQSGVYEAGSVLALSQSTLEKYRQSCQAMLTAIQKQI
jgi:hypothetical protein